MIKGNNIVREVIFMNKKFNKIVYPESEGSDNLNKQKLDN